MRERLPAHGSRVRAASAAREPGHRTKVAVSSIDSKVDAVGACVGVRGSRIKNIVDELGGEKIDIVRFNESSQVLIANALRPAEVVEISLCFELGRATVVVNEDQLSLAIGKRGQNVRLAARLTNWDVDILTPGEFSKGLEIMEQTLRSIEGITDPMLDRMAALGLISVFDIEEVGIGTLSEELGELGMTEELADTIVTTCSEKAKEVAVQQQRDREEDERRRAAGEAFEGEDADAAAQAAAILGMGDAPAGASAPAADQPAAAAKRRSASEDSGDIVNMLMMQSRSGDQSADVAMAAESAEAEQVQSSSPAAEEIEQSSDETDVAKLAQGDDESPDESPSTK